MTWFRRSLRGRHSALPRPASPPTPWTTAPPAPQTPSTSSWPVPDDPFAPGPVVRLGFADDSYVTLPPNDPRTRTFAAVVAALHGSSRSPVRPI